jgi:archaemetzincin
MPMNVKADYVKLAREKMAGLGLAFQSSSWSNQNPEEVPQTFENFLKVWRQDGIPRGRRNVLAFTIQASLRSRLPEICLSAISVVSAYFGLPTRSSRVDLENLKAHPKRHHQVESRTILERLASDVQSNDLAVIGIIAEDLCPTDQGNFVFGECLMEESWCVVSSNRLLENSERPSLAQQLRLFKIVTHEIAHLIGLPHCVNFECNMNGKNCLAEVDGDPFDLCPECTAKICFACNYSAHERAKALQNLMLEMDLDREAKHFWNVATAISPN